MSTILGDVEASQSGPPQVPGAPETPRRSGWRWWLAGFLALVLVAAAVVGIVAWRAQSRHTPKAAVPSARPSASASPIPSSALVPASTLGLTISPANRTAAADPEAPVTVNLTTGVLTSVTVSDDAGAAIAGDFVPGSGYQQWHSSTPLQPQHSYQVTAVAKGPHGKRAVDVATFRTAPPAHVVTTSIQPLGGTVGIGMPITITFSRPVTDRAEVQRHLSVQLSKPVPGAWHWFGDSEVHYRPQSYWPVGEQVTFTANLNGVRAAAGTYFTRDRSATFTVGDSHISTVNTQTHTMVVRTNGVVVRTFPVSTGRTDLPTINGVHVVWWKTPDVIMDSSTVGIPRNSPDGYYEHVAWDVNISSSGEFVHAAPWSVDSQGRANVSHGCVNLAPAAAQWFYYYSLPGDIVQVSGSPRPPSYATATADWNMSWSAWTAGSALPVA